VEEVKEEGQCEVLEKKNLLRWRKKVHSMIRKARCLEMKTGEAQRKSSRRKKKRKIHWVIYLSLLKRRQIY